MKRRLLIAVALILFSGLLAIFPSSRAQAQNYYWNIVLSGPQTCAPTTAGIQGSLQYNIPTGVNLTINESLNGAPPVQTISNTLTYSGVSSFPFFQPSLGAFSTLAAYTYRWDFILSGAFSKHVAVTLSCTPPNPTGTAVMQVITQNTASSFTDGRCNLDPDQSVAVYPDGSGGYKFYALYKNVGYFALHLTKADLDANPDKGANYLIAQAKGAQVYRLAGGQLQVNRLKPDGKLYEFIWSNCG